MPEPVKIAAASVESKPETGLVSVQNAFVIVNPNLALIGQCPAKMDIH